MSKNELLSQTRTSSTVDLPCGRVCDDHMREARLIQSALLPTAQLVDHGIEIAFRLTPFYDVGGDFLEFFRLPNGFIGLYMGDVVGKGLPAAMYGALVMGILRGIHKSDTNTAAVLSLLNQRLLQRPLPGRFCCTLYAVFDPATRKLAFSNAGLPYPLHATSGECQSIGQGGLPSGLLTSATYENHTVQLSPGDSVLFATDGLHEWSNADGVELSSASMFSLWAQCHSKSARESIDRLFEGLLAYSDGARPQDDITAIVLKVPT